MAQTIQCPACSAPFQPGQQNCPYCGQYIHAPELQQAGSSEARLPYWTQGLSSTGSIDGSFDARDYPPSTLTEALGMLHRLPVPPAGVDPGEFAPPTMGYGERCVSRNPDGSYFLWPDDRDCTLPEAENFIKKIYEGW